MITVPAKIPGVVMSHVSWGLGMMTVVTIMVTTHVDVKDNGTKSSPSVMSMMKVMAVRKSQSPGVSAV